MKRHRVTGQQSDFTILICPACTFHAIPNDRSFSALAARRCRVCGFTVPHRSINPDRHDEYLARLKRANPGWEGLGNA